MAYWSIQALSALKQPKIDDFINLVHNPVPSVRSTAQAVGFNHSEARVRERNIIAQSHHQNLQRRFLNQMEDLSNNIPFHCFNM